MLPEARRPSSRDRPAASGSASPSVCAQQHNIVLNGFGDAMQIEKTRADLAGRTTPRGLFAGRHEQAQAIEQMVRQTVDAFGAVDIMVNNAGIQHVAPIEEFPEEKWEAILAINLSSAFHSTQARAADDAAPGWGGVINVASAHALVGSPYKAAYVSAKHGMLGLTKVTALETPRTASPAMPSAPATCARPLVEHQIDDQARRTAFRATR